MVARVFQVDDPEGYRFLYEAGSAGEARNQHRLEFGLDWHEVFECRVSRCPAMDGLPLTTYYAMATGTITYAEDGCPGCARTLLAEYLLDGRHGEPPYHADQDGELWCSLSCWEGFTNRLARDRMIL